MCRTEKFCQKLDLGLCVVVDCCKCDRRLISAFYHSSRNWPFENSRLFYCETQQHVVNEGSLQKIRSALHDSDSERAAITYAVCTTQSIVTWTVDTPVQISTHMSACAPK